MRSENPTARRSVEVRFFYAKYDPDTTCWMFVPENARNGFDGWTLLTGVDRLSETDTYVLEFGRVSERTVSGDYLIWVQTPDFLIEE